MLYKISDLLTEVPETGGITPRFKDYLTNEKAAADIIIRDELYKMERWPTLTEEQAAYMESGTQFYRALLDFDGMMLHASAVAVDGKAYLFSGQSGIGTSTHTGLWLKHVNGSKIVNGDKPILEYKDGEFIAYGTPWMGKEGLGYNTGVPLKGLCFLEQAKENAVKKLTPAEAASRVFLQILFPQDEKNAALTLELTDKLVSEIPCYLLKCDISEEAVQKSFEALTEKNYKNK